MNRVRLELLAAALGLVGVLAIATITAAPVPPATPGDEVAVVGRAGGAGGGAVTEAQVAADRAAQLAPRLARATWGPDSLLILEDSLVPAWEREVASQWLRMSWRALQPGHADIRVAAAIVSDTGRVRPGQMRYWQVAPTVVLPERLDGRTCLVEVPIRRVRGGDANAARVAELRRRRLDQQMVAAPMDETYPNLGDLAYPAHRLSLGACGWLAAYGPPGRGMRAWLDSTGWRGASGALFVDTPRARAPWRTSFALTGVVDVLSPMIFGASRAQLAAQSCAGGAEHACRAFAFEAAPRLAPFRDFGMTTSLYAAQGVGAGFTEAFDPRMRLLDDVRRAIGQDRFRTLWRDDRDLPEAFASAVGAPLMPWLHAWTREAIRGSATAGPGLDFKAVAIWLLPCALVLLYTIRRVNRRQVARAS
jgi:hypothetical protein